MSWHAIKWIHWARGLTPAQRCVLHVLAYKHDEETGKCAPGAPYLLRRTGLSDRGLKDQLRQLAGDPGKGWFQPEGRTGENGRTEATQYHLHVGVYPSGHEPYPGEPGAPPGLKGEVASPGGEMRGEDSAPSGGKLTAGGGGSLAQPEGEVASPQLQVTTTARRTTKQEQEALARQTRVAPAGVQDTTWLAYLDVRKAKGAKETQEGQKLLRLQLSEYQRQGYVAQDIIEYCVRESSRGLKWAIPHLKRGHPIPGLGNPGAQAVPAAKALLRCLACGEETFAAPVADQRCSLCRRMGRTIPDSANQAGVAG